MKPEAEIAQEQSPLYLGLNNLAVEISSKLDAERSPQGPKNHSRYNWASEYHHPCKKFLVHCRLDWRKRQGINLDGRWRIEEGVDKEWAVKKWLGNIDYEITKSQEYWNTDDPSLKQFKALRISGKIDGVAPLKQRLPKPFEDLKEVPAEVKSIAPHFWESTKTINDIKRHSKFWISKIPSQLNTYLVFTKSPGGLLILCTFGKRPRILSMLFDQALWEEDCRMVKSVNYYVRMKKCPPPMPFDATICGMCDFNHLCTPLKTSTTLVEIGAIDLMELEMFLELKDQKKQFDKMKARLIGTKDKPGKYHGRDALEGNIEIKTIRYPKKMFVIPDEVKQKHRVEDEEIVKATTERIGK